MANWSDGYVTEIPYTTGFYTELTPSWLAFTALLGGQQPPDLGRPFRWAELGCGNGLTAVCVAATHPHAEVWGFDFNPAHIDAANRMASAGGLTNAHFREASFTDIARDGSLPQFDFVVTHGVLSWISPAVRADLLASIDRMLAPGGLLYVSYNVATGWDNMAPVQRLMRLVAETRPAASLDQTVTATLDWMERLAATNAPFFQRNPSIASRLKRMHESNVSYVAHEYLNAHWHPLMFADVAEMLGAVKCEFIASASLADNFDHTSVVADMRPMLAEAPNRIMRETLRDFASAQSFRRDVYRRGRGHITAAQQTGLAAQFRMVPTKPRPNGDFVFPTAIGSITGNMDIYGPLLDHLHATGSLSLAEARTIGTTTPRSLALAGEILAFLAVAGVAHPALPPAVAEQSRSAAAAFNRAITDMNIAGATAGLLVSSVTGAAISAELMETICREDFADPASLDPARLKRRTREALAATDRSLIQDGEPVTDPAVEEKLLDQVIATLTGPQWPIRRALGIYD